MHQDLNKIKIAVLIPCLNEETTISQVITDFKHSLPSAEIYVYDNNSTDKTKDIAQQAGAITRFEPKKGKGNVIRRMFADIEADVYVMVDGDGTYDASIAPVLINALINQSLDMVCGSRSNITSNAYRTGHAIGNLLFNFIVKKLFKSNFNDILSGYRVFSRRFVKSFPVTSSGFEIETELTIHSLELKLPTAEINTPYYARPEGSTSKLSTFKDGFRILYRILILIIRERPLLFFSSISILLFVCSGLLLTPILFTFYNTGMVPRFPTLFLCLTFVLAGFLSLISGLILTAITHARREFRILNYLRYQSLSSSGTYL